jgi:ligand-binding sensor domain-containing protein
MIPKVQFVVSLLIAIACLLPLSAQAQNWTNYYGTPQTTAVAIDAQGNKWYGTLANGVCKYDGTTWTTYNTLNSGIKSNFVYCVAIDAQGTKWVGGSWGVSKFDGIDWVTYDTSNSGLMTNEVFTIAIDAQGHQWVGGQEGVSKFDGTTWTNYNNNVNLASIHRIAFDAQGNKWFASSGGIYKFDGTTWTHYNTSNSPLLSNHTISIAIDAQGNKWIGSDSCVQKFNNSGWVTYTSRNSGLAASGGVTSILIDGQGTKWFALSNGSLCKFDGVNWVTYNAPNTTTIDGLAMDPQGNKWLSGASKALKFDGTNWQAYAPYPQQILGREPWLTFDLSGNKWFTSEEGITKFDGTNWTTYDANALGLGQNAIHITAVAIDSQNNKWFGLFDKGVLKFDGTRWTLYNGNAMGLGQIAAPITSIVVDAQNNKWIGHGDNGLLKFNGTTWTHYPVRINGFNSGVSVHAIDAQGNKWCVAANSGDGVFKFDGTTWTNYNSSNSSLGISTIVNISIDAQNNKWFWTQNDGLLKFNGTTWTNYNELTTNQLVGNNIRTLVTDAQGNKWVSSDLGLSKFNGTTWSKYDVTNSPIRPNEIFSVAIDAQGNKWLGLLFGGILKFDGTTWTTYNALNSKLVSDWVIELAIDAQNNKWIVQLNGVVSKFKDCAPAVQFGLQVMKGDSAKPLTNSTLLNPTTFATGMKAHLTHRGNFNTNGNYLHNVLQTDVVRIKRKSLAVEGLSELDGMDAFQLNLVVSDHPNATRSVAQLLAMDVNGDTKIDALDIAALMQRSVNPQTGFKQLNGDTIAWRHLPKPILTTRPAYRLSATFPNNDGIGISRHRVPSIDSVLTLDYTYQNRCDTATLNVVGVLLGDADGNYFDIGTNAKGALADTTLFFDGLRATKIGRDTFRVPVYANQRMFGLGLKIENYTNGIQILSISNAAEVSNSNRVDAPTKRCFLSAYSTNGNGIAANTPLCYVTVKTNCPFPSQFGTMTAYLNGTKVNTQVTWNGCTPTDEMVENTSVNVYPNPTDQQLTIDYSASVQTLSIVNLIGQTLKVLEINASGQLQVDVSELPKGVYFLRANNHQMTKFVKL